MYIKFFISTRHTRTEYEPQVMTKKNFKKENIAIIHGKARGKRK